MSSVSVDLRPVMTDVVMCFCLDPGIINVALQLLPAGMVICLAYLEV